MTRVSELGEFALIARLSGHLPPYAPDVIRGIGDDVAMIRLGAGRVLLLTCDIQVAGIHFLPGAITPYQLGHKIAAINLSDIGAAGGQPRHFLVSLGLPPDTEVEYLEALYDGLRDECRPFGADVVGGNVSRLETLTIDAFLVGETTESRLITRAGARPGDRVLVTGPLGASRAGLELVLHPELRALLPAILTAEALCAHLTPRPLVREGQTIAAVGGATAMLDVSDGLAADLGHICEQSRVGVRLRAEAIPVSESARAVAAVAQPGATAPAGALPGKPGAAAALAWALSGGEDFQLCFTVHPDRCQAMRDALEPLACAPVEIGEVLPESEGRWLQSSNGKAHALAAGGWDHFGSR